MRTSIRNTLAAVGATAAVATGGLGVAAAADNDGASSKAPSTENGAASRPHGPCEKGGPGGAGHKKLAKALGVSTSELDAAMKAIRPTGPPSKDGADDMAAKLAKKLDLSEAKVKKALEANRPAGPPPAGAPSGPPPAGAKPPTEAAPTG